MTRAYIFYCDNDDMVDSPFCDEDGESIPLSWINIKTALRLFDYVIAPLPTKQHLQLVEIAQNQLTQEEYDKLLFWDNIIEQTSITQEFIETLVRLFDVLTTNTTFSGWKYTYSPSRFIQRLKDKQEDEGNFQ